MNCRTLLDFEKMDMKKAKEIVGDKVCIYSNVPAAKMVYGSTEEVDNMHHLYYAFPNMKPISAPSPRSRRPLQTFGLVLGVG